MIFSIEYDCLLHFWTQSSEIIHSHWQAANLNDPIDLSSGQISMKQTHGRHLDGPMGLKSLIFLILSLRDLIWSRNYNRGGSIGLLNLGLYVLVGSLMCLWDKINDRMSISSWIVICYSPQANTPVLWILIGFPLIHYQLYRLFFGLSIHGL